MYRPKKSDQRKGAGPRKRSIKAKYARGTARATRTNLFPGAKEMFSLARGISESSVTNYKEAERNILEVSKDIKEIISKLEESRIKNENKT